MDGKKICRLCLLTIYDSNFNPVENTLKDRLNVLLIDFLNLEISKDPIICTGCATTLQNCFDFKTTCIRMDNLLCSLDHKEDIKLNLMDVYLKRNGSLPFCETGKNRKVCRFCLKITKIGLFTDLYETKNNIFIVEMLSKHIPEINISVTEELITCEDCLNLLKTLKNFILKCSYVEDKINKYVQSEGAVNCGQINLIYLQEIKQELGSIEYEETNHDILRNKVEVVIKEDVDIQALHEEFDIKTDHDDIVNGHASPPSPAGTVRQKLECNSDKPIYKCNFCLYQSQIKQNFVDHLRVHEDPPKLTIYKCKFCPHETTYKKHLKSHMVTHRNPSSIPMFKCRHCSYETKYRSSLKNHMINHQNPTELTMYKCSLCPYEGKRKCYLSRHMLMHKGPEEMLLYKCDLCHYVTKRKNNFKMHILVHKIPSEVTMYQCCSCAFKTKHKRSLRYHQLIHKDPSEITFYKCDLCPYQSKLKTNLKVHSVNHKDYSEIKMYKCELCPYQTKRKNTMQRHSKTHKTASEIEMFKCDICSHEIRSRDALIHHIRVIHKNPSELEMFKCDQCSFKSKHKGNLKNHMLLHMSPSERPIYKCAVCVSQFKQKRYLKAHMLLHQKSPS